MIGDYEEMREEMTMSASFDIKGISESQRERERETDLKVLGHKESMLRGENDMDAGKGLQHEPEKEALEREIRANLF